MDTAAAKYSAITCPCGYAILMTTAQGDQSVIETGIRSFKQAQKREKYWAKKEADAAKKAGRA
jgi:uncharacterized protein YqhQ